MVNMHNVRELYQGDDSFSTGMSFDEHLGNPHYGSGKAKIFGKSQEMIKPTFERLQMDDDTLDELSFRFIDLDSKEILDLASALKDNTNLSKLTFYKSYISEEAAQAIVHVLENNNCLKELELYQNGLSVGATTVIGEALASSKSLNCLSIYKNNIGFQGLLSITDSVVKNPRITALHLFRTGIGIDGAFAIADLLRSVSSLKELSVCYNNIGDQGMSVINPGLKGNKTLETLSLNGNNFTQRSGIVIADALQSNSTLSTLDLHGNNISNEGILAISEVLASEESAISCLDLRFNNLTMDGSVPIFKNLYRNKSIVTLKMSENKILDGSFSAQVNALNHRNKMILEHQLGTKRFGPFFYIRITQNTDSTDENSKIRLEWASTAWQSFSLDKVTVSLLHQSVETLYNLAITNKASSTLENLQDKLIDALKCKWENSIHLTNEEIHEISNQVFQLLVNKNNLRLLVFNCVDQEGRTILDRAKLLDVDECLELINFLETSYESNSPGIAIKESTDSSKPRMILERYSIENWPDKFLHKSITSRVYAAIDFHEDTKDEHRRVALKFLNDKKHFERELQCRQMPENPSNNGENMFYRWTDGEFINKNRFSNDYVLPLLRFHEEELCLVMPLADRNLEEIIRNEGFAGVDFSMIQANLKSIALAINYIHERHEIIHGDIKPRNFVRIDDKIKMIDFSEGCQFNRSIKLNTSTGYMTPEVAKETFVLKDSKSTSYRINQEKMILKKLIKLDRTKESDKEEYQLWEKELEHVKNHIKLSKLKSDIQSKTPVVQPNIDVWSFGVLSYYMLSGSQLFICDQSDNIFISDVGEQQKLVHWEGFCDDIEKRICCNAEDKDKRLNAIDLLRRCLHPDPKLRFSEMRQVLNHIFFTEGNSFATMNGKNQNSVKYPTNTFSTEESSPIEAISYRESKKSQASELSTFYEWRNHSIVKRMHLLCCSSK